MNKQTNTQWCSFIWQPPLK